jgi:hypothetical protein
LRSKIAGLNVPEDPDEVLRDSSLFHSFPDASIPTELSSLTWRTDAMLGLSTVGVLAIEDELVGVTRHALHDGLPHQELSSRLFGADFDAIHGFMDTVPGATYRGGGIMHRLQHGHDVGAARQIYDEHGLPGLLVWTQHIAQDAATPTGIPAPGGRWLADWLVEEEITSPGKAALLVSFNVAEMAVALMAGAFAFRLAALMIEASKRRRVRRRIEHAAAAQESGDLDAVIAHYEEARSLAGKETPGLDLALGWAYSMADRPMAQSFLAFRSAAEQLAVEDRPIEVGGLMVSLRGMAYSMTLSQAVQVLRFEDMQGAWRGELGRLARGGIASFESMAIAQDEGRSVEFGDRKVQLRPRPLSAAANYYMAARTAAALSFLPVVNEMTRLTNRAGSLLVVAESVHSQPFAAVRARWEAELAPSRIASPS